MLTGESRLVEKIKGQEAVGGAINGEGAVVIEVHKTGDQTYLSQIIALVRQAQETLAVGKTAGPPAAADAAARLGGARAAGAAGAAAGVASGPHWLLRNSFHF